jgi:hypothetical protein
MTHLLGMPEAGLRNLERIPGNMAGWIRAIFVVGESGMSRPSYCQHRIQWIGLGEVYRISNVFPMKKIKTLALKCQFSPKPIQ